MVGDEDVRILTIKIYPNGYGKKNEPILVFFEGNLEKPVQKLPLSKVSNLIYKK